MRAEDFFLLVANVRGDTPEEISKRIFSETDLFGLQGPTISRVVTRAGEPGMYAAEVVVSKERIGEAVHAIRAIGGSGVVVSPVTYIFEEEPVRFKELLAALES